MTEADRLQLILSALNHFPHALTVLRLEAWRFADDRQGYRYEARASVVLGGLTDAPGVVGQVSVNTFTEPFRNPTPPAFETAIPVLLRKAESLLTTTITNLQKLQQA